MAAMRDRSTIEDELNRAVESVDSGERVFPGMSYAEGVDAALRWVLGDDDAPPMSDGD